MVHVSTAYVNINHAPGTTVHERIYPLMNGEVEVDGEAIAQVRGLSQRVSRTATGFKQQAPTPGCSAVQIKTSQQA